MVVYRLGLAYQSGAGWLLRLQLTGSSWWFAGQRSSLKKEQVSAPRLPGWDLRKQPRLQRLPQLAIRVALFL